MSIDMFSLRQIAAIVRETFPVKTPFLNTFFRTQKTSPVETIDIDFVRGTRRLAPFTGAQMQATLINKKSFERRSVQPPYIKIKDVTSAQDLLRVVPGQNIYSPAETPARQARRELTRAISDFMDMIVRREEFMAHQSLTTLGDITFSGEGISLTVNYNMRSDHQVTLAGNAKWDDTVNADPMKDIDDWVRVIKRRSGLVPRDIIMDPTACKLFIDHPKVQTQLDTRRIDLGIIRPQEGVGGLDLIAELKRPRIKVWQYDEVYENTAGVVAPIMTTNTVIVGARSAKTLRHYGAIKDLKLSGPMATRFFAKSWQKEDPSVQMLSVQSSPLPAPHQIDGFLNATVA